MCFNINNNDSWPTHTHSHTQAQRHALPYTHMQSVLSTLGVHGAAFEEHIAHQTATYRHTNKFANEHVPTQA